MPYGAHILNCHLEKGSWVTSRILFTLLLAEVVMDWCVSSKKLFTLMFVEVVIVWRVTSRTLAWAFNQSSVPTSHRNVLEN
jgi:hypothetical protein